jgi:hypothetical protein
LYPSPDLLYQIARLEDLGRRPEQIMRFAELVTPRHLMQACERLLPSKRGKPRRRDIVALEERILALTDSQGGWL